MLVEPILDTTLDISVDRHLAAKGIPAAQERVDACRIKILEDALVTMHAWVDHWADDQACNLTPTEGSLASARATIATALSAARVLA